MLHAALDWLVRRQHSPAAYKRSRAKAEAAFGLPVQTQQRRVVRLYRSHVGNPFFIALYRSRCTNPSKVAPTLASPGPTRLWPGSKRSDNPREVPLGGGFGHRRTHEHLAPVAVERTCVAGRPSDRSKPTQRRLARYRVGVEGRISHLKGGLGPRPIPPKGREVAGGRSW